MKRVLNQPGKIYATTKIHKFDLLDYITIVNLKFCPIIVGSNNGSPQNLV